jgi:quinol monooxygenase YgiN
MPRSLSYIVAKDSAVENSVWVTEAWESQASHDAPPSLRQVQETVPHAQLIVAHFEKFRHHNPSVGHANRALTRLPHVEP